MKIKKDVSLLFFGALLIIASVVPLFLIVQENIIDYSLDSRYDFEQMINIRNESPFGQSAKNVASLASPITWEGNIVEILTKDTGGVTPVSRFDKEPKHVMNVSILINGKEVEEPSEAWLAADDTKDSRFMSWLNILKVTDKNTNQERLAIVQRLSGNYKAGENMDAHTKSQQWRVLYLSKEKEISNETFSYTEKSNHILALKLVMLSSESASMMGYKSDIAVKLPSILFPLFYPTSSFIIGIILLMVGKFPAARRRLY